MPTTHSNVSNRKTKSGPPAVSIKRFDGRTVKRPEAMAFLMQQHRDVEKLFAQYESAEQDSAKSELSEKICLMLAVHAQIEEELLYPAGREAMDDVDLIDQAAVEHAAAKALIAQIETMQAGEPFYDAKVKVLGEYIKHHVEEEESELFPELMRSEADLATIGKKLKARAAQVEQELSAGGEQASRDRIAAIAEAGAHI